MVKYNLLPVSFEHGSTTNLNILNSRTLFSPEIHLLHPMSVLTADSIHRVNSVSIASQKLQTKAT